MFFPYFFSVHGVVHGGGSRPSHEDGVRQNAAQADEGEYGFLCVRENIGKKWKGRREGNKKKYFVSKQSITHPLGINKRNSKDFLLIWIPRKRLRHFFTLPTADKPSAA